MTFWLTFWAKFWSGWLEAEVERPFYVKPIPHRNSA